MIEVARLGAFGVNCVGLERRPFPLSFDVREAEGSWLVGAAAVQAGEVIDLLIRTADETVVVVALETFSFLDEQHRQAPLARIAAEQGVECTVHRPAVVPGHGWVGEEFLVLRRDDLPRFLDGWYPHDLSLVDLPAGAGPEQLDALALVLDTDAFDRPVLPRLDGSRFWYSGHDDCYLGVQTRDPALPPALLGRLLALLAGSVLVREGGAESIGIPEPAPALTRRLLDVSPIWAGVAGAVSAGAVTVELWALERPWRLGQELPGRARYAATLDPAAGGWRLEATGA